MQYGDHEKSCLAFVLEVLAQECDSAGINNKIDLDILTNFSNIYIKCTWRELQQKHRDGMVSVTRHTKKTFNKVRLQNLTSSGIRFGYYCCLTDLDKANLWGLFKWTLHLLSNRATSKPKPVATCAVSKQPEWQNCQGLQTL